MADTPTESSALLTSLSTSQRDAVDQYSAVTAEPASSAIPQLQRANWNVQLAVNRFLEGDLTTSDAAAAEALQAAEYARHGGAPANPPPRPASGPVRPVRANRNLIPAPRIVPQPDGLARRPPVIISLFLYPFSVAWKIANSLVNLFYTIFPFLPRLRALNRAATSTTLRSQNPRDTAARFIRAFEEEYCTEETGAPKLPWFEGGYAQALDRAKNELRYLLVILQSEEHDDTASFNRGTLATQRVVDFLRQNNAIIWGGSVQESEAYQVSTALNCTKFPFAALIALAPGASERQASQGMSVICRIAGPTPQNAFLRKLQTAIDNHSPSLDGVRTQRATQAADRAIREEQQSAYERSLQADRERARREQEAEEAERRKREDDERARREKEEKIRKAGEWRRWKKANLQGEPAGGGVRVSIRTVDGQRIIRKFASDAPMEEVYAFVECLKVDEEKAGGEKPKDYTHEFGFRLVGVMPRTVYEPDQKLVEKCLGGHANLVVEPLDDDESEDDE